MDQLSLGLGALAVTRRPGAKTRLRRQSLETALAWTRKAVKILPTPEALCSLGALELLMGDVTGAHSAAAEAERLNPFILNASLPAHRDDTVFIAQDVVSPLYVRDELFNCPVQAVGANVDLG
jgi:hypothetical protein